jgi:cytochrome P450
MTDLYSEGVRQNPYPAYDRVRRRGSAVRDSRRNVWYVGRYVDAATVLRDAATFSNNETGVEPTLTGADGILHVRSRSLMQPAFSAARIAELDQQIHRLAVDLTERATKKGKCEYVEELASRMPAAVAAWLLGVEETRVDDICRWSRAIVLGGSGRKAAATSKPRRGLKAMLDRGYELVLNSDRRQTSGTLMECRSFLIEHFERVRSEPGDGRLVDLLVDNHDNGGIGKNDLINLGVLLIAAATETTTNLLGNAVLLLADEPDIQAHVRSHPEAVEPFIEEVLRYEAPVQRRVRFAKSPAMIGDTEIPAGARVEVLIGSANRDPDKFPDPDQFRFDRKANRHLSFGSGPHVCLGSQLAKREAFWALSTLIQEASKISLAQPRESITYPRSLVVRGPQQLNLEFG